MIFNKNGRWACVSDFFFFTNSPNLFSFLSWGGGGGGEGMGGC